MSKIHCIPSWLVLIGNVQINFGVIWHFMLSFSFRIDDRKRYIISWTEPLWYYTVPCFL